MTADFPIDTAVDLTANAGFFKVHLLKGQLKVCNSSLPATCSGGTPTGHMLSVGLNNRATRNTTCGCPNCSSSSSTRPAALLDVDVNVRAYGDVR